MFVLSEGRLNEAFCPVSVSNLDLYVQAKAETDEKQAD